VVKEGDSEYTDVCAWAHANLPEDALVVCMQASGALYFYTAFPIMRWDLVTQAQFDDHAARLRASGRPTYALLTVDEQEKAFRETIAGRWKLTQSIRGYGVWRLEP
jgi:hypothetical protein